MDIYTDIYKYLTLYCYYLYAFLHKQHLIVFSMYTNFLKASEGWPESLTAGARLLFTKTEVLQSSLLQLQAQIIDKGLQFSMLEGNDESMTVITSEFQKRLTPCFDVIYHMASLQDVRWEW